MNWQSASTGQNYSNDTLSRKLRSVAQPKLKRRQLAEKAVDFGKRSGDTFIYDKDMNVDASTDVLTLEETERIPITGYAIRRGSVTVKESGHGLPWTEKYESLSEFEPRDRMIAALSNHMVKVLEKRSYYEGFNKSRVVYTPSGTKTSPSATWSVTGTAGATATRPMQVYDLKNIADAMDNGLYGTTQLTECPKWDGENFVAVAGVSFARSIKDDPSYEAAVHYGDPERRFSGEEGRIYGVRIVKETLISGKLSGSYTDECEFVGADAVMECVVTAEEIRDDIPQDHGRFMTMAWYYLGAFDCVWGHTDLIASEPDNSARIVRVRSA
jgi:N4-gp56 family major capsid protein